MPLQSALFVRLRAFNLLSRFGLRSSVAIAALAAGLAAPSVAEAQTPVALPYTITTLAGLSPMSATAGTQCPNLPTGVVSTDAFGDGCLAQNAIFGAAVRGGVQVDAFGNVFVADDINSIAHIINPATGIMTVLAGKGTACTAKLDSAGDGCLAATQTVLSSPRGMGIDPYGNVLLSGYGDNLVHMVCRALSPNCTAAQVGYMELVAGCVSTTGSGATGGVGLDNTPAKSVGTSCTTSLGEVDGPRGMSGDVFGNVYFADTASSRTRVVLGPKTSTFFTGNNPLYAALGVYYASLTQGYAYTVVNTGGNSTSTSTAATTVGQSCAVTTNTVTYTGAALDTYGDGCPLQYSSIDASSGFTSGVVPDAAGNMLFTDPTHGLRVLYVSGTGTAGAKMTAAIQANDGGVVPQVGFIYMLAGSGTTGYSATPTLGVSTNLSSTTITKVNVSPQGNVFIGDASRVDFYDMSTGYLRILFSSGSNVTAGNYCSGTSGPKSLTAYSDGCPVSDSNFASGNGLGVAIDGQGNLYLQDATTNTVRKVLAQGMAGETVNSSQTQNFQIHVIEPGAGTLATPSATLSSTPDITAGTPTCGAQNADFSFECIVPITTTPTAAGIHSAALTVNLAFTATLSGLANASSINLSLGSVSKGSVLVVDSAASNGTALTPTAATVLTGITSAGVALDGAGDVFVMDTRGGHFLELVPGTSTATLPGTLPTNASQLAIDQLGDVFAVGNGTSTIAELAVTGAPASAGTPQTYTPTSVAYTPVSGTAAPQAIAVDGNGNLFVADKQSSTAATAIFRISQSPATLQQQVTVATGFTNPVSLAVDPSGNVYVSDRGAPAVYKLTPGLVSGIPGYVQTTVSGLTGVLPAGIATDAAGNLYVQDATSLKVFEVPVTGGVTTVLTGLTTPSGLAVDGKGDVFSADVSKSNITEVVRDAVAFNFGTGSTGSPTYAATLTDVGNLAITGQNTVTNTTNFNVVAGASNGCSFNTSVLGAQAAGNACTLTANFIGMGSGTVSDAITYLPAATTLGGLTLTGTLTGTAVSTTTTVSTPNPANPAYSPSTGTPEVTFTVTVAAASGTPSGTVAVTVDSTTTNPSLVNGVATVPLYGLTAGTHTISAIYSTSGSFNGSNSGTAQTFTVAQDTTTASWTPGTTAVQYSSPIGTSALNATSAFGGSSVPGVFVYTANGVEVNAATYLAIGSYTLSVTFYPTDSVDYTSSTASGGTFSVTKASTTAPVGTTQNLVAADGTGNYTSLQTAINTLSPTAGGNLYIKPGTYTGFATVVTPFVSIYGLGGNPNNVVLTNENGAFSPPYLAGQAAGNNGTTGDAGSATFLIERGSIAAANGGNTYTPYNFYAENFTIQNTYDTDTVTTSTNALVGGTCTAGQPAQTLSALFNAGTECNSQALAIWITGDQAVLNNIYTTSLQDTIYAGSISAGSAFAARQYWFRGKVTGDVDYIFGDAAAVFDHTTIYTAFHGTTATGTETIEAQNQADVTSGSPTYLSGYIMNGDVFTSQAPGMTALYFGRPYGHYSTWIMLNSYIDQVAPVGYIEFSGDTNLPTSTYAEYNNHPYTDPATNAADSNGVLYLGAGGNTGSGVTGTREITSTNPGTPEVANNGVQINHPTLANTTLSQTEAQQYYPLAFLGTTVASNPYNNGVTNWSPTTAIANGVNGFIPAGTSATVASDSSVTILMRPQVPGQGAVTNGTYTIPTGTYTLTDSFGGKSTTLATGTLDPSGSAYYTTSALETGTHTLSWTYSGDTNFSGSTTASAYTLTVSGTTPTISLSPSLSPATYGQIETITATVTPPVGGATPTGNVTLTIDGTTTQTAALANGTATFSVSGLQAGTHTFTSNSFGGQSLSVTVNQAVLTVTGTCTNRPFDTPNVCTPTVTGYQYTDSAATVFAGTPAVSTTATRMSPAGSYSVVPVTSSLALTTFGSTNYTVTPVNTTFNVTGGVPQSIVFPALPPFPHGGSYKLAAQTTSGLPVVYSVTAGSASIGSGNILTITAAGPVTIKASTAADPTGDYAPATPVSQSFTAP